MSDPGNQNPFHWSPDSDQFRPPPPPPPAKPPRRGGLMGLLIALGAALLKYGFLVIKLFKFSTLASGLLTYAFLASAYGWQFGLGILLLVLVHEFGHMVAATREGQPVTAPIFALLGAFVRTPHAGRDAYEDARIAIAGPAAGLLGAAGCWLLSTGATSASAHGLFYALTSFGCFITLLNLLPMHPFDGGKVAAILPPRFLIVATVIFTGLFLADGNGLILIFAAVTGYVAYRHHRHPGPPPVGSGSPGGVGVAYWLVIAVAGMGMLMANLGAYNSGAHF